MLPVNDQGDSWREDADRRVLELAEMVRGCATFGNQFRNNYADGLPTADSPARANAGEETYGENSLAAFDQASSKIVVVEDLLRGFAILLGPPPETPFALQVILRSVLEVSAAAWYFADPEASAGLRAARVQNEAIENYRRNAALARNVKDEESRDQANAALEEALSRMEAEYKEAEAQGQPVIRDKKERPLWVGERKPSATELVTLAWQSMHENVGSFLYGFFSGVTHARPTSFMQNLRVDEELSGGRAMGRTIISLPDIELWTKVVTTAWADAMERLVIFAGWDNEMWDSWRLTTTRTLAGVRLRLRPHPPAE